MTAQLQRYSSRGPQLCTLQLGLWCAVCSVQCLVCSDTCTACSAVCSVQYYVGCMQCDVCSVQRFVFFVQCAVCRLCSVLRQRPQGHCVHGRQSIKCPHIHKVSEYNSYHVHLYTCTAYTESRGPVQYMRHMLWFSWHLLSKGRGQQMTIESVSMLMLPPSPPLNFSSLVSNLI